MCTLDALVQTRKNRFLLHDSSARDGRRTDGSSPVLLVLVVVVVHRRCVCVKGRKSATPPKRRNFLSWAEAGYSWWFSGNFGWFPLNFGWTWSHYARIYNQEIAVKYSYIWWSHTEFSQIFVYFRWIRIFSRKASRKSYDPLGALGAKFTKNSRITHCCSLVTRCTTAKTAKPRSVFTVQIIHFFEFSHFFWKLFVEHASWMHHCSSLCNSA